MSATPYPLSDTYMLCTYAQRTQGENLSAAGLYLIDAYGNRTLLHQDDEGYNCLSPIPVRTNETPVIPTRTSQGLDGNKNLGQATISVSNIYESDFEWPEGVNITHMRIIQIFPKYTSHNVNPKIGHGNLSTARGVLGVVPVEEDGSVYCKAPVGKAILFQALDENGLAVQSMRSATYVHEGENLSCTGCHEDKWSATSIPGSPIALSRPPSELTPDVEGSMPMQFTRLVQPVLDAKCVECHEKENALDLSSKPLYETEPDKFARNDTGPKDSRCQFWTTGYNNLGRYVYYVHGGGNGAISNDRSGASRTIAGSFGAHASSLLDYLNSSHYGVELTPEEYHRFTLWMDCNSEFFGAYHDTEKQGKGELVIPRMDYSSESTQAGRVEPTTLRKSVVGSIKVGVHEGHVLVSGVPSDASVSIYDLGGRLVRKIADGSTRRAPTDIRIPLRNAHGVYVVNVDLDNGESRSVPISHF